jgi:membrane carboxypeptidase/penicillin-binding protein
LRKSRILAGAAAALLLVALVFVVWNVVEGYVRAQVVVARYLSAHPPALRAGDLPPEFLRILLAVEDPAFYSHHGIDLRTPGAGLTTITQGLVKFLYFESFRPGLAKIRQSLLALGFDRRIDKQTQLTLFVNGVYLGTLPDRREVHGFDEAARAYFGKGFGALGRDEWIALVAMVLAPDDYSVAAAPDANAERRRRILRLIEGACRPAELRDVTYENCR